MNKIHALTILLALPALAGMSAARSQAPGTSAKEPKAAFSERITEAELVKLRSQSKPMTGSSPAEAVSRPAASSFADASDFISFNGLCTFVPKGAVLHVPDRMLPNMIEGLAGKLVLWSDFLTRFPAVVEPFEITIQEAAGAKRIEPNRLAAAMHSERIIVTVIGGNPTSLCEFKEETSKVP